MKKLYLDDTISPEIWIELNQTMIMNEIYDNIFEFYENGGDEMVIMEIIQKSGGKKRRGKYIAPGHIDVLLIKDDIPQTLQILLNFMENIEEYEKCAEIYKLIKKING